LLEFGLHVGLRGKRHEIVDAFGGLDAFGERCDQRDAHEAGAGIDPARVARQVAAGQKDDIIVSAAAAGELGVIDRRPRPEVEAGVGQRRVEVAAARRGVTSWNFSAILAAVVAHVRSSFQAAILAACTAGFMALPW
jgi:hypothetical protein